MNSEIESRKRNEFRYRKRNRIRSPKQNRIKELRKILEDIEIEFLSYLLKEAIADAERIISVLRPENWSTKEPKPIAAIVHANSRFCRPEQIFDITEKKKSFR